jgi:hypothetical protein
MLGSQGIDWVEVVGRHYQRQPDCLWVEPRFEEIQQVVVLESLSLEE